MGSDQNQANVKSISDRLLAATSELQELEKLVLSGDFSPRVLSDFRSAVDNVRQTAWAVQNWIGLKEQKRDPYSVLSALSEERVRRATQIARDLTVDLQSLEVGLETEGLAELLRAVEGLRECLARLFRKEP
jgi:hypothetical protein